MISLLKPMLMPVVLVSRLSLSVHHPSLVGNKIKNVIEDDGFLDDDDDDLDHFPS